MGTSVYAIPALTILMSWAVLDEVPRWPALRRCAWCLVGVAISRRRGKRQGGQSHQLRHGRRRTGPALARFVRVAGIAPRPGPGGTPPRP